jgi:hypothetical protein
MRRGQNTSSSRMCSWRASTMGSNAATFAACGPIRCIPHAGEHGVDVLEEAPVAQESLHRVVRAPALDRPLVEVQAGAGESRP